MYVVNTKVTALNFVFKNIRYQGNIKNKVHYISYNISYFGFFKNKILAVIYFGNISNLNLF